FVNSTGPPLNLAARRSDQVELHVLGFDGGQANDGFALRVFDLGYRQALLHQRACTTGEQKGAHGAQYARDPTRRKRVHGTESIPEAKLTKAVSRTQGVYTWVLTQATEASIHEGGTRNASLHLDSSGHVCRRQRLQNRIRWRVGPR